jgi:capsular polysaccharide biosynthesis protein
VYEPNQEGNRILTVAGRSQPSADLTGISQDEGPFTLGDFGQVIVKRLWVILLVTAVVVGQAPSDQQSTNLAGSIDGLQQLTQNMIIAIDTRPVAEEVISRRGLEMTPDELLNNLTIEQVESSQFIRLSYTDSNAEDAQQIVNTVGTVSSNRITNLGAAANNITATVMERAVLPQSPIKPDPVRNGLLAAVFGLMLGVGLAFLMEYRDHSWHSPEEVERVSGVPTFATIPEFSLAKRRRGR